MLPTRFVALLARVLVPCLAACSAAKPAVQVATSVAPASLRVAITVDDLPGSLGLPGWPKSRVVQQIIATLQAHQVPAPVGFVNGIYGDDADAEQALHSWLQAGFLVGNHSYSHVSANSQDAQVFAADVARNRTWLAQRAAAPQHTSYFRFPYLERGNGPEQRALIRRALHEQGYVMASVSLDFADWAFTSATTRCLERDDPFALGQLAAGYRENARAALFWSSETALRVYGRTTPLVLLLHAGLPTALNLEGLLTDYEQQGVEWISLASALADPAYQEPLDEDRGDFDTITEQIRRQKLPLHGFVPRSQPLLELACR